jgi:hypothetical protein
LGFISVKFFEEEEIRFSLLDNHKIIITLINFKIYKLFLPEKLIYQKDGL